MEFAMSDLEASVQGEYKLYASAPLGVDFTTLPDDKSVEVARWLSALTREWRLRGRGKTSEARLICRS